jgi:SAM-dependent methyltransferase
VAVDRDGQLLALWDASAAEYRRFVQRYPTHRRITVALATSLNPVSRDVLDFGCGPGNSTLTIKSLLPDARVTGLDYSAAMLAQHTALTAPGDAPHGEVTLVHGTIENHARDAADRYDAVVCSNSLFHVEDKRGALHAFRTVLREGGAIAFSVYGGLFRPRATMAWPYGDTIPRTDAAMTAIIAELARRGHHVQRGEDRETLTENDLHALFTEVDMRVRCTSVLRLRRGADERRAFFRIPAVAAEVFPGIPPSVVTDAVDSAHIPADTPPLERLVYTFLAT